MESDAPAQRGKEADVLAPIARSVAKYGACDGSDNNNNNGKCKNQNGFGLAGAPCEHRVSLVHRCELGAAARKRSGSGDSGSVNNSDRPEESAGRPLVERMARKIPGLGIMFALCASFFLGSTGMLVKLTTSVHAIQVAVFRALIQVIVYGVTIKLRQLSPIPPKGERLFVLGRALLGGTSITVSYQAIKLIPLGDATTIRFSLPIWTLIVSYFVLGEPCSLLKVFAVLISVSGVVLIAKPDDCIYWLHVLLNSLGFETGEEFSRNQQSYELAQLLHSSQHQDMNQQLSSSLDQLLVASATPNGSVATDSLVGVEPAVRAFAPIADLGPEASKARQLEGCLLALTSSICLALSLIALRLCKRTPAEVTILYLSTLSVLMGSSALLCLDSWAVPDNWLDVLYIVLNGICGSIGQWFITNALKIEQSGVIALARTCDIEVAFLYSALLLHEEIKVSSIIGSILVSSGVISVVVPKWLESRADSAANEPAAPATNADDGASFASNREASEQTTISIIGEKRPQLSEADCCSLCERKSQLGMQNSQRI